MKILPTALAEVKLIIPNLFRDERGYFCEAYSEHAFAEFIQRDVRFVQDNHTRSEMAGVVRGLHFQIEPRAQGKLVRVVAGAILDVAVDIRIGSPTFGRHMSARLTADNRVQAWIPSGFAHGFCTLEPATEVIYKVTQPYDPACDRGLAWDDPALEIDWPVSVTDAILSPKDRHHPTLGEMPAYFHFEPAPQHRVPPHG